MDKLKLFNLFVLAFLLSLVFQYIFPAKKQELPVTPGIVLSVNKESFTIPNIPILTVKNTSTGNLTLHPCIDFSLSVDSVPLTGMSGAAPAFCRALVVPTNSGIVLPMNELYQVFASTAGKYVATLKTSFGERTVFFTVEKPGIFRTTLSTLVYQPIYNLFVALLTFLPEHSLGWAIIILTFIVRFILLVPQQHMLESQKKMQKIQPKIQALQKEYKSDQSMLGMKMLELYKAENVNPMASIVPLIVQMPILIGLYWVISQINDPSNFYHLYSFFQGSFHPAEIRTLFYGVNLSHVGGVLGIIAGLMLAILQFIQAKLSTNYTAKKEKTLEKKEEKDNNTPEMVLDPAVMQNMMLYFFPLMIGVTAYFFPLGVALYWFIGTLFVIGQQAYVNRKK